MSKFNIEIIRSGKIVGGNVKNLFDFHAWPTVAKLKDGTLAMVCSGRRTRHIDPFGTTVICYSKDQGKTWSAPAPIIDTPLDDRDGGICVHPDGKVIVTGLTHSNAFQRECANADDRTEEQKRLYNAYLDMLTEEDEKEYFGSLMRMSEDGYNFGDIYKVPVRNPHGPVVLPNGKYFFVGESVIDEEPIIVAYESLDGKTWNKLCTITDNVKENKFCEPHAIGFDDGRIVVFFRKEGKFLENFDGQTMDIYQCESLDGGKTFSEPKFIKEGAPPYLFKHSSGTVICSYGYRLEPFAERVAFSEDECKTWSEHYDIDTSAKFFDHGYHTVAELDDGSLISVYYQTQDEVTDRKYMKYSVGVYYTVWKFTKGE